MATLFERLNKGQPTLMKAPEPSPAQKLLDWLQRWNKDTITTSEICVWGPRPLRNRKRALDAAERLVRNGWLIPIGVRRRTNRVKARKYDSHAWQVVRRPVLDPNVTTDSPLKSREPMLYPTTIATQIIK